MRIIDNNFIFLILVNTFFILYINIVILFYKKNIYTVGFNV